VADALVGDGRGGGTGFFFRFLPGLVATGAETEAETEEAEIGLEIVAEVRVDVGLLDLLGGIVVVAVVVEVVGTERRANCDSRARRADSDSARAALRFEIST
jgi:hypothetical protein